MTTLSKYIAANKLGVMKGRVRPLDHTLEIRRRNDLDNHIACQTEHLWHIARAVERIADAMLAAREQK